MPPSPKDTLVRYLGESRSALLWKVSGLSDYDVRRPVVPTATNLLGVLKHCAAMEALYFGVCFGRPFELPFDIMHGEDNIDMWAPAEESTRDLVDLFKRACVHADETINGMELEAVGQVPWWGQAHQEVSLHQILVHVVAEENRHAGHADLVRELVDGSAGIAEDDSNLLEHDEQWWRDYYAKVDAAAQSVR